MCLSVEVWLRNDRLNQFAENFRSCLFLGVLACNRICASFKILPFALALPFSVHSLENVYIYFPISSFGMCCFCSFACPLNFNIIFSYVNAILLLLFSHEKQKQIHNRCLCFCFSSVSRFHSQFVLYHAKFELKP